jgi:hypothetical protein
MDKIGKILEKYAATTLTKTTNHFNIPGNLLARIFRQLASRDREDGRATGQPQGVGPEAYLNSTSQGPTPEDARKDGHIRGRSRRLVKHPG